MPPFFTLKTPFVASRHFPQRGKITGLRSSPSGGSTGAAGVGGSCFPFFRVPREGGDLDPVTQAGGIYWSSVLRGRVERAVDDHPPTPNPLPLKGGKGFLLPASLRGVKQGPLRRSRGRERYALPNPPPPGVWISIMSPGATVMEKHPSRSSDVPSARIRR